MPGIYGVMARQPGRHPEPVANAMADLLTHQEWYARCRSAHPGVVIGALSTNPSFSAKRHLASRDGVSLLIEGTALRHEGRDLPDDTADLADRLLTRYLADGDDFIIQLTGQFNLVIDDARRERLLVMTDRLGFAHMSWYLDDDVLMFAPELKAFLGWRGVDRTIDRAAVASVLAKESPYGESTLLAKARLLPPGGRLIYENGQVSIDRYWRPEFRPEDDRSVASLAEEALDLFETSVRKRLQSHYKGRVLLALSGGLDSRLLLHYARERGDDLDLFTYGQPDCEETAISRDTARAVGLEHRWRLIETKSSWLGDNARRAVWLNDGQVNMRNATLVGIAGELEPGPYPFLSGILGPYMTIGTGHYCNEDDLSPLHDEDEMHRRVLKFSGIANGTSQFSSIMPDDIAAEMAGLAREQVWDSFQEHRHASLFGDQKMLHMHFNLGRRMQSAVYVNKFFFHDLTPFVDPDLFDLYLRIPLRSKFRNVVYLEMYKQHLPELARLPWSRTGLDLYASQKDVSAALEKRARYLNRLAKIRRWSMGRINPKSRHSYNHREVWLRTNPAFRQEMLGVLRDIRSTGCDLFDQAKLNRRIREFDQGRDWIFPELSQAYTVGVWWEQFMGSAVLGADLEMQQYSTQNRTVA